jgi:hypothetical protein
MQHSDSFTKCLFTKRSLSVCKLPLAEIINEEDEGTLRRRLSRSFYRLNRMQARLNISLELSSADLFYCHCLYFCILFFLFISQIFPSHLLTYYHRSHISVLTVRYQITPSPVWRVQSDTVLSPHFRSLLSASFNEHQGHSLIYHHNR